MRWPRPWTRAASDRCGTSPPGGRGRSEVARGTLSSRSLQIAHNSLRRAIRYAEANGKVGRNAAGLVDTRWHGSGCAGGRSRSPRRRR